VFLDAGGDEPPTPEPDALTSEAVEKLRDEVRCLRDRLHREPERGGGEAGRYQERYQQIIAALTSANASLGGRLVGPRSPAPPPRGLGRADGGPGGGSGGRRRSTTGRGRNTILFGGPPTASLWGFQSSDHDVPFNRRPPNSPEARRYRVATARHESSPRILATPVATLSHRGCSGRASPRPGAPTPPRGGGLAPANFVGHLFHEATRLGE
jgi:hypothetical protein